MSTTGKRQAVTARTNGNLGSLTNVMIGDNIMKKLTEKDIGRIKKAAEKNTVDSYKACRQWKKENGRLRVAELERLMAMRKSISTDKLKGKDIVIISVVSVNAGSSKKFGDWYKDVEIEDVTVAEVTPKGVKDSYGRFHKTEGKAVIIK